MILQLVLKDTSSSLLTSLDQEMIQNPHHPRSVKTLLTLKRELHLSNNSPIICYHSNLLRPSGVRLQSGTLYCRIYRAEDMPQMDPGYFEGVKKFLKVGTVQKELVDPYCTVNFAGHKGRTKAIMNEQDPEWNTQINLAIRVRGRRGRYCFYYTCIFLVSFNV